jgi:hypothetical protein
MALTKPTKTIIDGMDTSSITANGYQKLPGGLIMQWGTVATTQTGNTVPALDTNFPIAFPNACLSLQATTVSPSAPSIDGELAVIFNQTQFGIRNRNAVVSACWLAFGY